jgi:hypothetical protein
VPIDLGIVGRRYARTISWTSSQALLYALGVGAGGSDTHDELAFTTENSHDTPQQVLPTFAVVLGGHGAEGGPVSPVQGAPEIPLARILHGEQAVTLHGALPVTGTATFTGSISAVYDTGRHAVVESVADLRDAVTGSVLAETVSSMFVRGAGGFGGQSAPPTPWALPERPPDVTLGYPTRRDQALLYRLSGDRNPLHSDPWFARAAGLERPILHGLCTYGFAGRALLHLRIRRTGPPARGVRRGPRPLRQHVRALHAHGGPRRHAGHRRLADDGRRRVPRPCRRSRRARSRHVPATNSLNAAVAGRHRPLRTRPASVRPAPSAMPAPRPGPSAAPSRRRRATAR